MAAGWPGPGTTICVLGDAHLDVVVQLSGPVAQETDTPARTDVGVGGQAANVAAWIAGLGGRTRLIAAWGSDPAARLVADELTRRGVDLAGPVLDGRTGVVVSLSDRGRSRSMLTDRGVGPQLAALEDGWLADGGWLHLPAYSLVSWPVRGVALAAAERVPHRSLDLSSTAAIAAFGVEEFRELATALRPDVIFGTEAETDLVGADRGSQTCGQAGPARSPHPGRHLPGVTGRTGRLDRGGGRLRRPATWSAGSNWGCRPPRGRCQRWERCHDRVHAG